MEEIRQGTLFRKELWVVGKDENGDNIYEIRGSHGARYRSERHEMHPTLLNFIQARDTNRSLYGSTVGRVIDFGSGYVGGRIINIFTDIDGPLVPIHWLGFNDGNEVPGFVGPDATDVFL